jgi:hypothetical protein
MLAARRNHHFAGLEDSRGDGLHSWLDFFGDATDTAAREAERLAALIDDLQQRWLERFPRPPARTPRFAVSSPSCPPIPCSTFARS